MKPEIKAVKEVLGIIKVIRETLLKEMEMLAKKNKNRPLGS